MYIAEQAVDEAMTSFVGTITQIPPMYSAVKVKGRKLYEYARAGEEVERPQRQIEIYSFERTSPIELADDCARFTFRVRCGKGTYVRTPSVDLGAVGLCQPYVQVGTNRISWNGPSGCLDFRRNFFAGS